MRAPGMTWFRLPLFVWAHYATSLIMILGTPVVAITILLLAFERVLRVGIFDPTIGGDPVLFQHLFWFYSHPPSTSWCCPAWASSASSSPRSRARTSSATASSRSRAWRSRSSASWCGATTCSWRARRRTPALVFSILTYLVGVPSAVKMFNWTATLYKGSISYETPMLYAFGFIGLFLVGGLTGLFLAAVGLDIHVHRHLLRRGALPLHHGGRHADGVPRRAPLLVAEDHGPACIPEGWAKLSALLVFVGFNLTFFPQFIAGLPRACRAATRCIRPSSRCSTCCRRPAPPSSASATCSRWSI